jgi:hypothetical protein
LRIIYDHVHREYLEIQGYYICMLFCVSGMFEDALSM